MIDPRRARSRFGAVVAAALALGVLLALRLPTIQTPILNVDEADFAVEAGSLLDGGRPYVDFVEKKPPLIYAAYAGALSLVGRYNLPGVRLLLLGYVLATALVLGAITRRLFGPRAAWLVPPLYAAMVSAGPPMDVHAANPETFFLLPLLVGTRLALSARAGTPGPGLRRLLGAGAFLGVASLFKQQAAIQLPVLLLALLAGDAEDGVSAGGPATAPARPRWAFLRGLPSHARVRSAGALAAGFAAVWLVTLVVLAAIGSLGEFIYWTIDVNRYYIANGNNLPDSVNRFRRSVAMLVSFLPLVWIAGLGGLAWHLRRHRWRRPLLPLWLVGSLVRSVRLLEVDGRLEEVLDSPFIGLVRALDLSGSRLHNLDAERIAGAPRLEGLRGLMLGGNDLDDRGVEALAGSRHLALTTLGLAGNVVSDEGVRALAGAPPMSGLRELDLARVPFGDGFGTVVREGGVAVLAGLPLRRLVLRGNPVGDAGAAAFARGFEELRELDLAEAGLGPSAAWALAAAPSLGALDYLDLGGNPLGAAGARALCDAPFLPRDLTVVVRDSGLDEGDVEALRARFADVVS